jgi:hypothetical protein
MKNVLLIITGLVLMSNFILAQQAPYVPGEKASYTLHYGIINGGIATLELRKDTFAGMEVLHSSFLVQTTGMADAIYKVKDVFESYINPRTELPLKSVRNIREGKYKKFNVVSFDHKSRSDSTILTSNLSGIHVTQKGMHDILSCIYYFRKNFLARDYPFKDGEMVTIMTWFNDKLYPIQLKYMGLDDIKTKAGTIKCFKFNPVTEKGKLFELNEDVSLWFSADRNNIPVKVRLKKFKVGAITVELNVYERLADSLEIK